MRVLGIDPGTAACGYGIVQADGGRLRGVDHGWWRTSAGDPIGLRLKVIHDGVTALIAEHDPDAVAIEESYVGANARIALSVGQARGAVLVACAQAEVFCLEYPRIREAGGLRYGRADKGQVERMVKAILGLAEAPTPSHAADALAVAICHALAPPLVALVGSNQVISRLRGRPVASDADGLVLDVGGVGYRIAATPSALRKAEGGEETVIETHLHVREDALQLYGFASSEERELFEHLLSVSGVGPKVALAIVSGYSPGELRRAIVREDDALFQSIPGIGKKTAQRVVLELKEKIATLVAVEAPHLGAGDGHVVARDALVELGYTAAEAEQRLADTDPELSPAERVRQALRAA